MEPTEDLDRSRDGKRKGILGWKRGQANEVQDGGNSDPARYTARWHCGDGVIECAREIATLTKNLIGPDQKRKRSHVATCIVTTVTISTSVAVALLRRFPEAAVVQSGRQLVVVLFFFSNRVDHLLVVAWDSERRTAGFVCDM